MAGCSSCCSQTFIFGSVRGVLLWLVVGHTDNQGELAYNVELSKRRADSVIQALGKDYGIDTTRLGAYGDGMTAPVASNDTEEGRAENRRD